MVSQISGQSTGEPPELETRTNVLQILHGLGLRHSVKVHFIERGNDGGPITPELAMEIHGMIAPIPQEQKQAKKYGITVSRGR